MRKQIIRVGFEIVDTPDKTQPFLTVKKVWKEMFVLINRINFNNIRITNLKIEKKGKKPKGMAYGNKNNK